MRALLGAGIGAGIGVVALAGAVLADVIVDWEATASVSASATSGYFNTTDSCSDTQTYTGPGLITDTLQCTAQAGYGSGASTLSVETTVTGYQLSTNVSGSGGGAGYGLDYGGFSSDFDQVEQIVLPEPTSIYLDGTVEATESSTSTILLRNAGGVLTSYTVTAEFEPVSFIETLPLDAGSYELVVSLRCRPRSAGPGGAVDGAVSASLFASITPTVAVESTDWGHIKSLYR